MADLFDTIPKNTAAKPAFVFYFVDSPHIVADDERNDHARRLRAWRRSRAVYTVRRIGLHSYSVKTRGGLAEARIEARQ